MKINEVDPRNYDSDIDYYNALNRAGRKAYNNDDYEPEPKEPYDAEDDIAQQRQRAAAKFRQKREVEWDPKTEGTAPNGQKYNSRYVINAETKGIADAEARSFTDYHWGAKKLVDSEYGKDGNRVVLTLYIVDNHKHGMWKPWADQPAQESVELDKLKATLDKFKTKSGKFPEPREPRFKGDQGSKSETLGRDGKIYHWQDPRAKQGVAEAGFGGVSLDLPSSIPDGNQQAIDFYNQEVDDLALQAEPEFQEWINAAEEKLVAAAKNGEDYEHIAKVLSAQQVKKFGSKTLGQQLGNVMAGKKKAYYTREINNIIEGPVGNVMAEKAERAQFLNDLERMRHEWRNKSPEEKQEIADDLGYTLEEIEQILKTGKLPEEQSVAEGTSNIGNKIKALYQKVYDQGDDSIDYMYHESPVFAQIWDEYEGDLDSIIAEVDPSELQVIANELEAYLQGPGLAEGEERLSIGQQMARDGIVYSPEREREIIGQIGDYMEKNGYSKKAIRYYMSYDEDFIPDVLSELPRAGQDVAEGQTPEQEIERLKLRQNAEHGSASLKRQAKTQARIRELEKQIKDKKGVAEGSLEEIDRRGFLKGMGAAAVTGAAGGANAQQVTYSPEDVKIIIQGVELYFALSSREATTSKGVWGKDRTKSALDKIAKNPEGKKIIQDTWKKLRQQGLPDETDMDIFTGNKGGLATQRLQRLEQLVAFNESAQQGVAEGFKNTYSVGDRVDGPLGTGVIVAVSPHISVDGRVKVKLDDPSRAGEDGKYKDTFVLDTTQLKHIADEKANPYAIGMAQAMKSTGDKPPLKKSTINKAHEIARAIKKQD